MTIAHRPTHAPGATIGIVPDNTHTQQWQDTLFCNSRIPHPTLGLSLRFSTVCTVYYTILYCTIHSLLFSSLYTLHCALYCILHSPLSTHSSLGVLLFLSRFLSRRVFEAGVRGFTRTSASFAKL